MQPPSARNICARLSHWAVLAAGVLIGSAATRNDAPLDLLRSPVVARGTIVEGIGTVTVAPWFPVPFSVLTVAGGELVSRVADLALPQQVRKDKDVTRCTFDFRAIASRLASSTFALTYFPWFRFLGESAAFDAEDSVADQVAECLRFMLAREGIGADVEQSHDAATVRAANGLAIEVVGMEALGRIVIDAGPARSSFDFNSRELLIDRRMFPEAFAAGHEMLATPDRPIGIEVREAGDQLAMRLVREAEG
ncbi:MAG TPA: hypothetical protein VHA82_00030 [Ramlibacter sp.]|uniref:hypothetical protein n=1 Tax=Ramlibacter sp. TaxID=1917967 RepID=UPI002CBCEE26|nr:hypothetical protein [Ramlibacter sp.]HVZ42167.1 hypothetical protein [Ramlibacter sp.]